VLLETLIINAPLDLNSNYSRFQYIFSCKNSGICAGVQLYDTCSYNSECYYGMYCNEGGRCVKYKELGDRCSSNEACGKKALCIFETTLSTYGFCQEVLSMSENTLILPMYKADMADTDSNIFIY
jgi:hypothetical protein